jgi:hypothetical protein
MIVYTGIPVESGRQKAVEPRERKEQQLRVGHPHSRLVGPLGSNECVVEGCTGSSQWCWWGEVAGNGNARVGKEVAKGRSSFGRRFASLPGREEEA